MPTDVYVKFGTGDNGLTPIGTPRPQIDGDSTDALHYWWCELRSCGFELEAKDPKPPPDEPGTSKDKAKDEDEDTKESKAKFQKVTLAKRVDWASTQLFIKCCEQAKALSNKSKEEQKQCWINVVRVEVCRPADGTKIPFVVVEYHDVRIIHYSIDIGAVEPSESITFEFEKMVFTHTRTDPYTGNVATDGPKTTTGELKNAKTGQSGTAQGAGTESDGGGAPQGADTAAPAGGSGTVGSGAGPTAAVAGPANIVTVLPQDSGLIGPPGS